MLTFKGYLFGTRGIAIFRKRPLPFEKRYQM